MKKYYLILAVGIFSLAACQKEEMDNEAKLLEEPETKERPAEYLRAEVDGRAFEFKDSTKIGGTVYLSPGSKITTFDFSAWSGDNSKDVDYYDEFNFKICYFEGPGTYLTGTVKTISWSMYRHESNSWEDHPSYGGPPGKVVVTRVTDGFAEGTFEFTGYGFYDQSALEVKGEFGLVLEPVEEYHGE